VLPGILGVTLISSARFAAVSHFSMLSQPDLKQLTTSTDRLNSPVLAWHILRALFIQNKKPPEGGFCITIKAAESRFNLVRLLTQQ